MNLEHELKLFCSQNNIPFETQYKIAEKIMYNLIQSTKNEPDYPLQQVKNHAITNCIQKLIKENNTCLSISNKIHSNPEYKIFYVVDLESWPFDIPYTPDMLFVKIGSLRYESTIPDYISEKNISYHHTYDVLPMALIVYCTRLLSLLGPKDILYLLGRHEIYFTFERAISDPRVMIYKKD